MFPRFGRNRDAGRTRWWKLEGIDRFFEITTTDVSQSSEEDISDLVPTDDSFLILETVFEESSYHFCIFRKRCDRSAHISWWQDPVFIAYGSSCPAVIRYRNDSRDIVVEIPFESIEDIERSCSTSDGDDIDRHT